MGLVADVDQDLVGVLAEARARVGGMRSTSENAIGLPGVR